MYLLHGDLTEKEMASLYNHPKVKVHVSFTKGEGFGRPLLEASLSGKPVIAPGWSGHLDFLDPNDSILLGGHLNDVHDSAIWDKVIIKGSKWFDIDPNMAATAMVEFVEYAQAGVGMMIHTGQGPPLHGELRLSWHNDPDDSSLQISVDKDPTLSDIIPLNQV